MNETAKYSFAEAMNIVGNGGMVNRDDFPENWYIMLDEDNTLAQFKDSGDGELVFIGEYAVDLEDIKHQGWYLKTLPQPKDTRTEDEIEFDEELLSIKESLETMKQLGSVDGKRFSLYYILQKAIDEYEHQSKDNKKDDILINVQSPFNNKINRQQLCEDIIKQLGYKFGNVL